MEDIVIVSAVRTAVGKFGGSLAKVPAVGFGALVIQEALARANVGLDQVGESSWAKCWQRAWAKTRARQAMMKAGVAQKPLGLDHQRPCRLGPQMRSCAGRPSRSHW